MTAAIHCYRGSMADPRWLDVDIGLCIRVIFLIYGLVDWYFMDCQMTTLYCALLKRTSPIYPSQPDETPLEEFTTESNSLWHFSLDSRNYKRNFAGLRT